jgi:uncharacterized YccA/Bax inhibitor family protein
MDGLMKTPTLMKQPAAFLPVAMSMAMLLMLLCALAWNAAVGPVTPQDHDEGVLAHIFQLTMILQVPVAAFFAIRWLPRAPGPALLVLALQAMAWLAAFVPVFMFKL